MGAAASFRWILQLHKDVPTATRFYSQGLDFSVNVCTLRCAELQFGPLKLALMQRPNEHVLQKGYSSKLSFTVNDINGTVTKLMSLGGELDGPINYEIHGKVATMCCLDGHILGLYESVEDFTFQAVFSINRCCMKTWKRHRNILYFSDFLQLLTLFGCPDLSLSCIGCIVLDLKSWLRC